MGNRLIPQNDCLKMEQTIQLNVANKDHGEVAERVSVLQGEKEVWH